MARSPEERSSRKHRETKRFRDDAQLLGVNVRRLREAKGWTLEKADQFSGVDWKHWQKIEAAAAGSRSGAAPLNPTLATLSRIALVFGLPVSALFLAPPKKKRGAST